MKIQELVPFLTYFTFISSAILHELAHGYIACKCGDDTAKRHGRLSLNPLKHIDAIGSVMVPIIMLVMGLNMFGWAKPVPVNFEKLNRWKRVLVSGAGLTVNLALALFGLAMFYVTNPYLTEDANIVVQALCVVVFLFFVINFLLLIFNLMPFPPFDGWMIVSTPLSHAVLMAISKRAWIAHTGLFAGIVVMGLSLKFWGGLIRKMTILHLS